MHKDLDKRNALLSMGVNAAMIGGYVIAGLGFYSIFSDLLNFLKPIYMIIAENRNEVASINNNIPHGS